MSEVLLRTTVVGSYPQPDWLVDREALKSQSVPRVRVRELWRVAEPFLEQAQDDATLVAIRDMERAGIDIISDGEIRRESYSNRLATALDGIDIDNPGQVIGRTGHPTIVPRVVATDPPAPRGRGPRRRVPAPEHGSCDQDHPARPVHAHAPGEGRVLPGRGSARDGLRGGDQRRSRAT